MSQYIQIATPDREPYYRNYAISRILSFLGEKYKEKHNSVRIQMRSDDKVGLDFINKKCGKGCKTAIRNLMYSKKKLTVYHADYRNWKFHKRKAEKFFKILQRELKKLDAPEEIQILFDYIYADISRNFQIEKCGGQIIGYPYRSAMKQAKNGNQYSRDDKMIIAKIEDSFPAFDELYRG